MDYEKWYIETQYGTRVEGPIDTKEDAFIVRKWIEKIKAPETFWIRSESESHTNRVKVGI